MIEIRCELNQAAQGCYSAKTWNWGSAEIITSTWTLDIQSDRPRKRCLHKKATVTLTSRNILPSFKYYIHDSVVLLRLQLIGELTEPKVTELSGCWLTVRTTLANRQLVLDLRALKSVDESGKRWLASMAQEGATCLPENYLRDIVAGKYASTPEARTPVAKGSLFGRLISFFRSVETAK